MDDRAERITHIVVQYRDGTRQVVGKGDTLKEEPERIVGFLSKGAEDAHG